MFYQIYISNILKQLFLFEVLTFEQSKAIPAAVVNKCPFQCGLAKANSISSSTFICFPLF